MKFIKLTDGQDEKRTYAVRIDSIVCIETYINDNGKELTWLYSKDYENGCLFVKETKEEILNALQLQRTIDQVLKNVVR